MVMRTDYPSELSVVPTFENVLLRSPARVFMPPRYCKGDERDDQGIFHQVLALLAGNELPPCLAESCEFTNHLSDPPGAIGSAAWGRGKWVAIAPICRPASQRIGKTNVVPLFTRPS